MTREEKLMELLKDDAVRTEIFAEDADQTLANLAAHGVEMTSEELSELGAGILGGMDKNGAKGELSEDALENVAGGGIITGWMWKDVYNAVKGGYKNGRSDKRSGSLNGMSYVNGANTIVGKGWRAIGYTIGWYLS